jgi:hypothetical protein
MAAIETVIKGLEEELDVLNRDYRAALQTSVVTSSTTGAALNSHLAGLIEQLDKKVCMPRWTLLDQVTHAC